MSHEDDDWEDIHLATGTAQAAAGSEDSDNPIGVIWIPDMEQRRGWRGYYVYPENKAPTREIGFGRRKR